MCATTTTQPTADTALTASVPEQVDVDLLLAFLHADDLDIATYLQVLAAKLEGGLGDRVTVERTVGTYITLGGHGERLTIANDQYVARLVSGRFICAVSHTVRGIPMRTKEQALHDWLPVSVPTLAAEAERSAST
jgi:hypothetical protein